MACGKFKAGIFVCPLDRGPPAKAPKAVNDDERPEERLFAKDNPAPEPQLFPSPRPDHPAKNQAMDSPEYRQTEGMKVEGFLGMTQSGCHERAAQPAGGALDVEEKSEWAAERNERSPVCYGQRPVVDHDDRDPKEKKQTAGDDSLKDRCCQSNC